MAVKNYSASQILANLNGGSVTDWGSSDPAFTISLVNDASTITQGNGGNAVRFDLPNPLYEVTLNLSPGGPNSSLVWGNFISKATISFGYTVIATLESFVATEGAIINIGTTGRAGPTTSDDTYVIHFNNVTMFKGGNTI